MNDSPHDHGAQETGRILRPVLAKDQTGWLRWLPGVHVVRHDDASRCSRRGQEKMSLLAN